MNTGPVLETLRETLFPTDDDVRRPTKIHARREPRTTCQDVAFTPPTRSYDDTELSPRGRQEVVDVPSATPRLAPNVQATAARQIGQTLTHPDYPNNVIEQSRCSW